MRALVAILVFVLAACSPGASASAPATTGPTGGAIATPSAVPPASEEPIASSVASAFPTSAPITPTWTPLPMESVLVNTGVTVLVDRLNIREMPAVAAKSLGIVEVGDFLLVREDGPFVSEGYNWYQVTFLGKAGEPPVLGVDLTQIEGVRGWIATAKGSTPYVRQFNPRCPSTIDLASVEVMLGAERLACFGSNTLELSGTFGCGGCGGAAAGSFEPSWLAYPLNAYFLTQSPVTDRLGPFALRFGPDGPEAPNDASVVTVRGHFDDAAADTCKITVIDPLRPEGVDFVEVSHDAARIVCAQQFVVESIEVLGTETSFPFG
jgi:hypothetical protein